MGFLCNDLGNYTAAFLPVRTDRRQSTCGGSSGGNGGALISQRYGFSAGKDIPLGDMRYRVAGVNSVGSRFLDGGVIWITHLK